MKSETTNPGLQTLKADLQREKDKTRFRSVLKNTVFMLVVVAAIAVLVSTIWFPVLRIFGKSMSPTVNEGQIVVTFKGSGFGTGDIIGFYYGNKLLIKRCIAGPGDWVDIKEDGTVLVNNVELDETYIEAKAYGECNIELPYQVPDGRYFVMGDNRETSVDSRNTAMGCIAEEQVVGKIILRIWPIGDIGAVD